MNNTESMHADLVSYCGFYCGACPTFINGKCKGCKGDDPVCATGYKSCKVRPCCIEHGFNSCAYCNKFESPKDCAIYNPLTIRLGQFLTQTNRRKGIEMIKEKGELEFAKYMSDKGWVTIKTRKQ